MPGSAWATSPRSSGARRKPPPSSSPRSAPPSTCRCRRSCPRSATRSPSRRPPSPCSSRPCTWTPRASSRLCAGRSRARPTAPATWWRPRPEPWWHPRRWARPSSIESSRPARLRLAGRAPVRRALLHLWSLHVDPDRGPAATARLSLPAEDPGLPPPAQVAGHGLLDPMLVRLERGPGPSYQPAQVGDLTDRQPGMHPRHEAQLVLVEVPDAGQVPLVEQRLRDRTSRVGQQPPEGLVLVPVRPQEVRAEVTDRGLLGLPRQELHDTEGE